MAVLCGFCAADRDALEPHTILCQRYRAADDALAGVYRLLDLREAFKLAPAEAEQAVSKLRMATASLLETIRLEETGQ